MLSAIHHWITSVPPESVPGKTGQESVSHEPWVVLLLALIGASGGILAAVLSYMSNSHAVAAKEVALTTQKATEEVHSTVKTQFDAAVGTPNGHGSLMDQNVTLMQNQHEIQQAQARQAAFVNESMQVLHTRVSKLDDKLDGHVAESAIYRSKVEDSLDTVETALDTVEGKLDSHVAWEMTQKYATPPQPDVPPTPAARTARQRKTK